MTGIAFFRKPLPALARSKLMRWELGGSDRGGQDKARKVRAVGCVWVERGIPAITQTLCSTRRNFRF